MTGQANTTELNERLSDWTLEWETRRGRGEDVSVEDLCRDCPDLIPALREQIAKLERMNALLEPETIDLAATTVGTASS